MNQRFGAEFTEHVVNSTVVWMTPRRRRAVRCAGLCRWRLCGGQGTRGMAPEEVRANTADGQADGRLCRRRTVRLRMEVGYVVLYVVSVLSKCSPTSCLSCYTAHTAA